MNTQWEGDEGRHTICVDWNGVLDTYKGFTGDPYPPRTGAKEFLQVLKGWKFKVVILSSADTTDVLGWLKKYDMMQYVDGVTNHKVPAIIYLDDRGITFNGNFDDALHDILKFKCFWEDAEHRETPNIHDRIEKEK